MWCFRNEQLLSFAVEPAAYAVCMFATYISFVVGDVLFTCSPETFINEQVCVFLCVLVLEAWEGVFFWVIACCFFIVMLRMQSENNNSLCSIGLNDERACSLSPYVCMCSWTVLCSHAFCHLAHSNSQLCALNGLIKGEKGSTFICVMVHFQRMQMPTMRSFVACSGQLIHDIYTIPFFFPSISHSLVPSTLYAGLLLQVSLMHSACESRTDSPISTANQSMWVRA